MSESTQVKLDLMVVGVLSHFLFGGWSFPLSVLVTLMVFDYLSGLVAAVARGDLSSKVGAIGIARKVGILMLVSVAHLADVLIGLEAPVLRTAVTWFYVGNEGISVIENLDDIGIPIPRVLRDALAKVRSEGEVASGDVAER